MARLYLVRHGEPVGTFTDSADPGLSPLGHEQAKAVAERLKPFGALAVVSSPLRRAQETAAPFAAFRGLKPTIAEGVAEIPTPSGVALAHRGEWLRGVMTGRWADADASLRVWRDRAVACLQELPHDAAIFSHYVAINVAVAAAQSDERVTVFAPAHCSITVLDASPHGLKVVELGKTGQSVVR